MRHGESRFIAEGRFQGRAESPLTDTGRRQAAAVAARLADQTGSPSLPIPAGPPREIVHSPLGRAAETAQAIAAARADGPSTRPEPGFAEIGQGEWEGLRRDDIVARYGPVLQTWRTAPTRAWAPGGESLPEVADRLRPALAELLGRLGGGPAGTLDMVPGYAGSTGSGPWSILVGHDGVFKILFLTLFDLPLERFWMVSFDLCGIGIVEFRAGRPILRAHNLTEHLAPRLDEAALAERAARESSGAF